jgi:hypothetical protein
MQRPVKPKEELRRAGQAIAAMEAAKALDEFEDAWLDYLGRIERVWYKSCAHFQKSPKWKAWHTPYAKARDVDPLLSYLTNARGSDEHSVEAITTRIGGSISINPAEGNSMFIEHMEMKNDVLSIQSPHKLSIDFFPARTRLLPVTKRGRTYNVPTSHLGNAVDPENVIEIARSALAYYEAFIATAEAFLCD